MSRCSAGYIVRSCRETAGYSASKLSEITGISKTTISKIENDHVYPRLDIFTNLINACGFDMDIIMKENY